MSECTCTWLDEAHTELDWCEEAQSLSNDVDAFADHIVGAVHRLDAEAAGGEPRPVPEVATSWYNEDECRMRFIEWRGEHAKQYPDGLLHGEGAEAPYETVWRACWKLHHPERPPEPADPCGVAFNHAFPNMRDSLDVELSEKAFRLGWDAAKKEGGSS